MTAYESNKLYIRGTRPISPVGDDKKELYNFVQSSLLGLRRLRSSQKVEQGHPLRSNLFSKVPDAGELGEKARAPTLVVVSFSENTLTSAPLSRV